jgi:hypothetical protein
MSSVNPLINVLAQFSILSFEWANVTVSTAIFTVLTDTTSYFIFAIKQNSQLRVTFSIKNRKPLCKVNETGC